MIRRSLLAIFLSMCSVVAWAADGDLDLSFNSGSGASNSIYTIAQQPDGKMIIGGFFTAFDGVVRNHIARLNSDGSLDISFNPDSGANASIRTAILQIDSKIIIAGQFTTFGGKARTRIARLNTDGTLDNTFDPGGGANNSILAAVLQDDNKVIVGGVFTKYNDIARSYIARLNSDGSLDASFNPGIGANDHVYSVALQPDGKIIVGGWFSQINGTARNNIARLNSDGSLDASFDAGSIVGSVVRTIALEADGKIIIGGDFSSINGTARNGIARLNSDGSLDTSFNSGSGVYGYVKSISVQPDGKVIIVGFFTSVNGVDRRNIARLNSDGSVDDSFNPGGGANYDLDAVVFQNDGRAIIGGAFTYFNDMVSNRIARLEANSDVDNDGTPDHLDADDDNDGVLDINDKFPLDPTKSKFVRHDTEADGDSDLLTRSASLGTWTRHTVQNAAITGSGAMNAYTSSSVQYVAQLDANGDGDADILTRNTSTGVWYLHQVQSGAVTGTTPIYLYANLDQQFIGTGDFNNDGTDDVMLRSASGGYYTVFLLANHGVSSTVFYNAWTSVSSVPQGIGDFDGDGTDDLLVRRTSDNLYFVFKTTNGATTASYCACNIWNKPDWTFQFAGDTNKDGIDDIVIRGTGATGDGLWWNFRMNNFSSTQTTNLNTFKDKALVSFAASGDYSADGHTDMLIRVNNGPVYLAKIVNGLVSGSTTLLSNLPSDQVVLK